MDSSKSPASIIKSTLSIKYARTSDFLKRDLFPDIFADVDIIGFLNLETTSFANVFPVF